MSIIRKIFRLWLPPLIWAVAIFTFSSRSVAVTSEVYWQDFVVKKIAHLIEYAILAILVYRGLIGSGVKKQNAALFAVGIAILYGASDEFHQSFTPGRQPRVRDVFFDTIGAILGIYSLWNLLPKMPAKLKKLAEKLQLI